MDPLRYLVVLCLALQLLFAFLLVAPLPGGTREKVLKASAHLYNTQPHLRNVMAGLMGLCALQFAFAMYKTWGVTVNATETFDMKIAHTTRRIVYERDSYAAGFATFMFFFLWRFQAVLQHYITKAKNRA